MAAGAATALMGLATRRAPMRHRCRATAIPLTDAANATFGCEVAPGIGDDVGELLRVRVRTSRDCTWFNTAGGTVPGDGVVQTVTIRSGSRPAQLRFVVVAHARRSGRGHDVLLLRG